MKICTLIAAALMLAAPALAQTCGDVDLFDTLSDAEAAAIARVEAETAFARGLVWTAEKGDSRVTVVGTLHVPDPGLDDIYARVADQVAGAELLILEATEEDEAGLARMATENPEMFFLTEGPSLIDLLGEEDWALAAERFQALGMPPFIGAKFRPWYAGMVLGMPPCVIGLMTGGEVGLDRRLEQIAMGEGVRVVAIENATETLQLLMGEDDAEDLKNLRLALRGDVTGRDAIATTIRTYLDERPAALWELGRILSERAAPGEGAQMFDEFSDVLLHTRNAAWEADLPKLIAGRDAVIAVGAAHLPGETGVLRALERMGYKVTPLP